MPPHTAAMLLTGCYDIRSGRGGRHRRAHEQGADRALPRRRAARGDLPDRDDDRRRRPRSWASTRSSCAGATSCARSRTGPRSAGPTTRATSSAASTPRWRWLGTRRRRTTTCSSGPASRCASSARAGCTSTRRSRAARTATVVVAVGSTPNGQGHETLFAQIAADRLGIDAARVTVRTGDTDAIAEGVGSFASRSTVMGGSAVAAAADDLLAGGPGVARFASEQVFASGAYVGGRRGRARDRRGARAAAGRGRRRGHDRQPAAGRGPGHRRRGPGPRRRADRGGRPRRARPAGQPLAAGLHADDRGRDPRVRDRVRRDAVAVEPARR